MHALLTRTKLVSRAFLVLAVAGAILTTAALPGQAAGHPLPVKTVSGTNHDTPDPGVLLFNNKFYAFSTGAGLRESTSATAAGPWTTPVSRLVKGSLPHWANPSKGIWDPDMIRTTSGTFVVYFAAALRGTAGHPAGNDRKPANGARCIGSAHSKSPTGPFTASSKPLVCFKQYSPADNMDGDPGTRARGDGVIGASPVFVDIGGHQELFLVYKTQANPGAGQHATIRMVRLADANGTTVLGESHQLLVSAVGSFADTIEAPALIQHGKWFVLFVAHGNFASCNYSTEWFSSQHIWSWNSGGGTTLLSSNGTHLCGPGTADVAASRVAGQDRIFFNGWVVEHRGVISTTPLPAKVKPRENVNAARVMYAAVLKFGSDGFTPILGAYQGQN
ncbi:MAG TPA: family 43 glycosylhydrolase [Streptosporangiaceae bacterium]|nr:family 43 glycosylhydrolase [Streptosporangiaceae bacterium]